MKGTCGESKAYPNVHKQYGMQFLRIVFSRIGSGIIVVLAVLILNFLLIHMAPGDPADVIAGEMGGATEEMLASFRAAYGLDKSLPEQLFVYLGKAIRGDLGHSFFLTGLSPN